MNALVRSVRRWGLALVALPIAACSDGGSSGPREPAAIASNTVLPGSAPVASALTPSVKVTDSKGAAIEGVTVTFEVTAGGGTLTSTSASSDGSGIASPGTWTLGTNVGANTLVARHGSLNTTMTVNATAVAAAGIAPAPGNPAQGTAGAALPLPAGVRVTDQFGNPVAGAVVTFTPAAGSGSVTGGPRTTGADGIARPATWTLGTLAGAQSMTAAIGALNTLVTIQAVAGPPASLLRLSDSTQVGDLGLPVSEVPSVRVLDQFGNSVSGITVTFVVTTGGGSVTGGTRVSDANGIATATSWTLGIQPATNRLTVTAGNAFTSFTALAAGPSGLVGDKLAGDNTTCPINIDGCVFAVRVIQTNGQPAVGQQVTWSNGVGGTLNTTTDARGVATAGNIPPNNATGPRTQTAEITASGQQFTFNYALVAGGGYNIDVRYLGTPPNQAIQNALTQARQRWEQVITADLGSVQFGTTGVNTACGFSIPAITGLVEEPDIIVFVQIQPIDGVGNTLGGAGPCWVRTPAPSFPIVGVIVLDSADVQQLEQQGGLYHVVLHEMGHTLGFPALWLEEPGGDLLADTASTNPHFIGIRAAAAHLMAGGTLVNNVGVPVENAGGAGSVLSHWRELVLGNELMTSQLTTTASVNPLSAITIGSLMDIGYQVNFGAAEAYTLPGAGLHAVHAPLVNGLRELRLPPPRVVPQR